MYAACQSMFSLNCHSVQHFYGNENGTEGGEENSGGGKESAEKPVRNLHDAIRSVECVRDLHLIMWDMSPQGKAREQAELIYWQGIKEAKERQRGR